MPAFREAITWRVLSLAVDGRLLLGDQYSLTFQGGGSVTRAGDETTWAPIWFARLNKAGRRFGLTVRAHGFHEDFRASSGFFSRVGIGE